MRSVLPAGATVVASGPVCPVRPVRKRRGGATTTGGLARWLGTVARRLLDKVRDGGVVDASKAVYTLFTPPRNP